MSNLAARMPQPSPMTRLALLGCGTRGSAVLAHIGRFPAQIITFDPDPTIQIDAPRASTIPQAVSNAELIIIAVPDRLALVRKLAQVVQATCPVDAEIIILSDAHEQDALRSCATRPMQIHGGIHADFDAAPLWRALVASVDDTTPAKS